MVCDKKYLLIAACLLWIVDSSHAQYNMDNLSRCFEQQQKTYPQEKISTHVASPYCMPGDRIWFRTYVVDAIDNTPLNKDKYVYAELIDTRGLVVKRVKVLSNGGVFAGYLDIPAGIFPAHYFLRCYTLYSAALAGYDNLIPINIGVTPAANLPSDSIAGCTMAMNGVLHCKDVGNAFRIWMDADQRKSLGLALVARGCLVCTETLKPGVAMLFEKARMPQGISQFFAFDDSLRVVGRKLVFMPDGDGIAEISFTGSSLDNASNSQIVLTVPNCNDSASLSLSVTKDSAGTDTPVSPTAFQLLVSQEIKGGLPWADTSRGNTPEALARLDSLLNYVVGDRCCVDSVLKKRYRRSPIPHETTQVLSGCAMTTSPHAGNASYSRINLISSQADMFAVQTADKNGRFAFSGLDYADSTIYMLNATTSYTKERTEVKVDEVSYPKVDELSVRRQLGTGKYSGKGFSYDSKGGIMLDDILVTANKRPQVQGTFSSLASYSVTSDEIDFLDATCIHELLRRMPAIYMKGDTAYIRGPVSIKGNIHAAVALDGFILDDSFDLDNISMQDIARIDVFKGGNAVIWGAQGGAGVISITTKKGTGPYDNNKNRISRCTPLGYQQPKSVFFNRDKGSKRSVYWNGDVRMHNGKAVVNIPFALHNGHYTIRVEGVTDSGLIVNGELKLPIANKKGKDSP